MYKKIICQTKVELQWLEHLLNHENMSVNHSARSGGRVVISFDFLAWKVCCVFSLKSPHRGDSNEYTQYATFNINTKNQPKLSQICSYEVFSKELQNEFETAVVNESSVFEPLKFYCITITSIHMKCQDF